MAHQIEIRDGEASMMYVGEEPWHGLGTRLNQPATSAEAIRVAKLDWQVAKKPLWADDDKHHMATDLFAVVREDQWGKKEEDWPGGPAFRRAWRPRHTATTIA